MYTKVEEIQKFSPPCERKLLQKIVSEKQNVLKDLDDSIIKMEQ